MLPVDLFFFVWPSRVEQSEKSPWYRTVLTPPLQVSNLSSEKQDGSPVFCPCSIHHQYLPSRAVHAEWLSGIHHCAAGLLLCPCCSRAKINILMLHILTMACAISIQRNHMDITGCQDRVVVSVWSFSCFVVLFWFRYAVSVLTLGPFL